jgi:dihydrodipicolinate synthase/N-acetylneuraminate lyase
MTWRERLQRGTVIPAHPLALTADRRLDERRQRALTSYYLDAGAGGIAVGVHTTQFAIREHGLFEPVLALALDASRGRDVIRVAGICGKTTQAVREAQCAARLGYHAGLLSMAALPLASIDQLIDHARAIGEILPLFGFYLQPAVGGRELPFDFWRRLAELPSLVAVKIAPFNRYQTLDVLRGVAASGRAGEIALYTGNDDNIVVDLLSGPITGGLLGHWAFWTRRAVELVDTTRKLRCLPEIPRAMLTLATETTDANAAVFDSANRFRGCIPGIHEVLRRQGLLAGRWCLDEHEELSPGQLEEIDRVYAAYPHLNDDEFVRENLDRWLSA